MFVVQKNLSLSPYLNLKICTMYKGQKRQAVQATYAIHKGRIPREPLTTGEFGDLRNWAIYFLMSLLFFNLGCLLPLSCLFQEELLLPFQLNPEAVKVAEDASSSVGFLILIRNITLKVPTGTNIPYSFSIKQTLPSSAFLK